jgi:hypothetical protein
MRPETAREVANVLLIPRSQVRILHGPLRSGCPCGFRMVEPPRSARTTRSCGPVHTPVIPGGSRQSLGRALDDLDELVDAVALATGELDELPRSLHDRAPLGRPCDRDAPAAPELEQPLVA